MVLNISSTYISSSTSEKTILFVSNIKQNLEHSRGEGKSFVFTHRFSFFLLWFYSSFFNHFFSSIQRLPIAIILVYVWLLRDSVFIHPKMSFSSTFHSNINVSSVFITPLWNTTPIAINIFTHCLSKF